MRRRNSSIDGMRCGARSRIVQPSTRRGALDGLGDSERSRLASCAARRPSCAARAGGAARSPRCGRASGRSRRSSRRACRPRSTRPCRRRREPGLQRLVAAARRQHVEAGLLVRRAAEDAQAAADAVAEVEARSRHRAPPARSNTTSRLRMNAGSSCCFIARWRFTISSPNMRRMYGFMTPPKR